MKKIILILGTILVLTGCNSESNNANGMVAPALKAIEDFSYSQLNDLTPVYNELDKLTGYLVRGMSNECGSDCEVDTFFIKQVSGQLEIEKIDLFSSASLGSNLYEENKYLFRSNFIWEENEGHFGCHKFKFQKIKFINNKFVIIEERVSSNKYAFDLGGIQGQCGLFPGTKNAIKAEKLFE